MELPSILFEISAAVREAGGRLYLVGGFVRDHRLGRTSKDLDMEVHGLEAKALEKLLRRFGNPKEVGRSFGVYKLAVGGSNLDISLPRRDSLPGGQGGGEIDPFMGLEAAARRRDLTVNALFMDPDTGEIIDVVEGLADLETGTLREVDAERFSEDPLRALRAVRLASVLEFELAPSLRGICRRISLDCPGERIWLELAGVLNKAPRPGDALRLLADLQMVSQVLPGLEGAVDDHLCACMNRAGTLRGEQASEAARLVLMVSALLHPVRTPAAVKVLDHLVLHRWAGEAVRTRVLKLIEAAHDLTLPLDDDALRRLAESVDLRLFVCLVDSIRGEGLALDSLARLEALGLSSGPLPLLVGGEDALALGIEEGQQIGALLTKVREAQYAGRVKSREEALAFLSSLATG